MIFASVFQLTLKQHEAVEVTDTVAHLSGVRALRLKLFGHQRVETYPHEGLEVV
jgi:hypothetical protein